MQSLLHAIRAVHWNGTEYGISSWWLVLACVCLTIVLCCMQANPAQSQLG